MHVLFVSACEKRAIKRTRAVLDSYALRAGEKAWASPMTQEGLREVRAALKRTATRQTAVACYRNEGRQRMKLLWVVGSRQAFGPDGHFPVGTTRNTAAAPVPDWVRVASLLARAGGWCHDFGKASRLFQRKLRASQPAKDCVRHEWVSMRLLQALRAGQSWDEAWERVGRDETWLKSEPFEKGIATAWDALDYLVVTHHRLLGPADRMTRPDIGNHFSGEPLDREGLAPAAALPPRPFDAASNSMGRIEKLAPDKNHIYWRAVTTFARAGLILADHVVSAREYGQPAELYANTQQGRLNQPLPRHLEEVAHLAGDMAYRIATLRLPGLSEESVESIRRPAQDEAFLWQNRAADALSAFRERSGVPMLLFNMAGTGSGKTRMNARAACVLSTGRVRFAVSLNLRTLTLQTGDAFKEQLNIGADEMACIIGDKVTQTLHENYRLDAENRDENPEEPEFEASTEDFAIPGWLDAFAKGKPALKAVVGAPVLVSTVDFLAAAGMPHLQGHHVAALLRCADSDLVLDEVDGYDPKPLVALLRLAQAAALFGRNLICSTATLAEPVAEALHAAYRSGAELRAALLGEVPAFACALIDNYVAPSIAGAGAMADFPAFYAEHIGRVRACLGHGRERIPYLQPVAERSIAGWREAVLSGVLRLHHAHAWTHGRTGKRISFGLVRVANIGPAIATARFLADNLPEARVACYHAQDYVIQRYLKERRLDYLLTRKQGNARIEADAELMDLLSRTAGPEVVFIVVATPVEEVGRDHDFDWAVIEPSSTRSIVQTAGRVNRHRKRPVALPNIALLQYNLRWASGRDIVFCRPGFEEKDEKGAGYPCHDLGRLLDWSRLQAIDAGLIFDGHEFAELDNRSIGNVLMKAGDRLFDVNTATPWWTTQAIYDRYPLREREARIECRLHEDGPYQTCCFSGGKPVWTDRKDIECIPRVVNDWLAWSDDELFEACRRHGLSVDAGMRFSVRQDRFVFDLSFGACHG